MTAARWMVAIGLTAVLTTAGCGTPADVPSEPRHDLDPLVSRFPGIGQPISATWVVWDNNSDRLSAPGPSTYWIDAVIELEPRRAEQLRATARIEATPTVHDMLRPHVPPGPFLAGAKLDEAITENAESTPGAENPDLLVTGYLERAGNWLVLKGLDGT